MKTPSSELFEVIKSLTSQEKRYFQLYVQHTGRDRSYKRLFDAINSLELYDEKALQEILARKGGISNLNRIKNYLQEAILRFLEQHYSSYSVAIELQRSLQRIEILYSKRLFDSALKTIKKAEALALENDHLPYLLLVLHWKYRIVLQFSKPDEYGHYINEGHAAELRYIDIYRNLVEYKKIFVKRAIATNFQSRDRDSKTVKALTELLKDPLLQDERKAISHRAKELYHHNLGQIYFWLRDWPKCYENKKQAIQFFEDSPSYEQDKIISFLVNIGFMVGALVGLKRNAELLVYKRKADQFVQSLPKKLQTNSVYNAYMVVAMNYIVHEINSYNLDAALAECEKVKPMIHKYCTPHAQKVFYNNFFMIYFFKQDYRKALSCINKIFATEKIGARQDVLNMVKLSNIFLHYELGNEDLLPGLCRSAQNYFTKRGAKNTGDLLLMEFFSRTIQKTERHEEKTRAFIALRKKIEKLPENAFFIPKDFTLPWLDGKIQGRPMLEVMREKARK